jgi:hypothetical protein
MSLSEGVSTASEALDGAMLSFQAEDVTGSHAAVVTVQKSLPAEAVTRSLVVQMALPDNMPYGLRDEKTGAFLDDRRSIGEQIEPGGKVTVTTKTHLG